ncbi:hypothetical protein HK097_010795 [Rhizophlyctis rosea]|uniref:F-box domain-containing protein n=1 Tax=Rhizophlyctis rosea TaxID=64517 RepID=A0AAD5S8J4_9FUNG|nr:hypothetical protein HK097_010795 [Rhizophlyctis rosea]
MPLLRQYSNPVVAAERALKRQRSLKRVSSAPWLGSGRELGTRTLATKKNLLDLPMELVCCVLRILDGPSLGRAEQTCRILARLSLVAYKSLYLWLFHETDAVEEEPDPISIDTPVSTDMYGPFAPARALLTKITTGHWLAPSLSIRFKTLKQALECLGAVCWKVGYPGCNGSHDIMLMEPNRFNFDTCTCTTSSQVVAPPACATLSRSRRWIPGGQCRALAAHKHGGLAAFEHKLATKKSEELSRQGRLSAAQAAATEARKSWLLIRLKQLGLSIELDQLRVNDIPKTTWTRIQNFIESPPDFNESADYVESLVRVLAVYLVRNARRTALVDNIKLLTPDLWPHYDLLKFYSATTFNQFVEGPTSTNDPNALPHLAKRAAEVVVKQVEREEQTKRAIADALRTAYATLQAQMLSGECGQDFGETSEEAFVKAGLDWTVKESLAGVASTARTRVLIARKAAERYLEFFVAEQERIVEERHRAKVVDEAKRQSRTVNLILGLSRMGSVAKVLPITEQSDAIIKQYHDDYIKPLDDNCANHDTLCLQPTIVDITNRYRCLTKLQRLDRELRNWMPDHVGYDSLVSIRGREVHEQFGKFGSVNRLSYWAREIYRAELIDRALAVVVPSFNYETATQECINAYESFFESPSALVPMLPKASTSSKSPESFTSPKDLVELPDVDGLGQIVTFIYELENCRMERVRCVKEAVGRAGLGDSWKVESVRRVVNADYGFAVDDGRQSLETMLNHFIYDSGYPPAETLEDAIQQALNAQETASRVQYIQDEVRNHADFQALFEDAYERHDFINGFFMNLILRCSTPYRNYINRHPMAESSTEVVEKLVRMVQDVRKGVIPEVVCYAVHTYFTE